MSAQMMQRLRELVAMQSPAIQVTAPSPELLMTPVIPNLPGNDALVSPGAAAASGSSGSSGAAKRTPKARRLLSLQFEPSESSRVVKVKVTVTHISNPVEETICTVIGMSSQGAALAYTRLSDGATCVYIADEKNLPQGIRKKIMKADSKIADRQPPANAERLEESDFTACMLKRPSGGSTAGYVCTRKGPLFGVTCDSAMVTSLTHVGFWRRLNQSYNYRVLSEALRLSDPPTFLPLQRVSRLCRTAGVVPGSVTNEELHGILLAEGARRPFGDRPVSFKSAHELTHGLMHATTLTEGCLRGALRLTRDVLGSTQPDIGSFVVCANQETLPWIKVRHCLCHMELGVSLRMEHDLLTRPRCTQRQREAALPHVGEKRAVPSSATEDATTRKRRAVGIVL